MKIILNTLVLLFLFTNSCFSQNNIETLYENCVNSKIRLQDSIKKITTIHNKKIAIQKNKFDAASNKMLLQLNASLKKNSALSASITELEKSIKKLDKAEVEKKIADLELMKASLIKKNTDLYKKLEIKEDKIKALEKSNNTNRDQFIQKTTKNKKLAEIKKNLENKDKKNSIKIAQLESENKKLKEFKELTDQENSMVNSSTKKLQNTNNELKIKVELYEKENKKLKDQLSLKTETYSDLKRNEINLISKKVANELKTSKYSVSNPILNSYRPDLEVIDPCKKNPSMQQMLKNIDAHNSFVNTVNKSHELLTKEIQIEQMKTMVYKLSNSPLSNNQEAKKELDNIKSKFKKYCNNYISSRKTITEDILNPDIDKSLKIEIIDYNIDDNQDIPFLKSMFEKNKNNTFKNGNPLKLTISQNQCNSF